MSNPFKIRGQLGLRGAGNEALRGVLVVVVPVPAQTRRKTHGIWEYFEEEPVVDRRIREEEEIVILA